MHSGHQPLPRATTGTRQAPRRARPVPSLSRPVPSSPSRPVPPGCGVRICSLRRVNVCGDPPWTGAAEGRGRACGLQQSLLCSARTASPHVHSKKEPSEGINLEAIS